MAYSTQADVQSAAGGSDALLRLSDVEGANAINAAEVTSAIAEADAMIDSYAKKRFEVPFSPVPQSIAAMSKNLAVFILKQRRLMVGDRDIELHEFATQWLRDLSRGVVVPGHTDTPNESGLVVAQNSSRDSTKVVSRDKLKGFW